MFLVEEPQLIKVNFKPDKSDFANDNYYKQLYIGEISWCRKNTEITLTIHTPLKVYPMSRTFSFRVIKILDSEF